MNCDGGIIVEYGNGKIGVVAHDERVVLLVGIGVCSSGK